jgi:2-hydroxy-3-keto-5-methylthiopentenyl-1-phosphate phosphatase
MPRYTCDCETLSRRKMADAPINILTGQSKIARGKSILRITDETEISGLMNLAVLCDFDGTVTTIDTAEFVLERFAQGDFRTFDRQFERGKMTLEECLNKQFSLVNASRNQILAELKDQVVFRRNFKKMAEHCKEHLIPLVIVSAGLDFVVKHFLKLNNCLDLVNICTPKTAFSASGIRFTFPTLFDRTSENFKQDLVRWYKSQDKKVIFIGNGVADFPAIKDADYAFVIRSSRLAKLCESREMACEEIAEFQQVIEAICKIEIGCK